MSSADEPDISRPDDPRLAGWYHTIDIAPGITTRGLFDHRPIVNATGLPDRMDEMTALDVGTANGFFAFEMERRGAAVVAVDAPTSADWDWLPQFRHRVDPDPVDDHQRRFELARQSLGLSVEHRRISVYDLSPETVGEYDFVFCGALLLHLQNPLGALAAMRSVTRGSIVVEVCLDIDLEQLAPGLPAMRFSAPAAETEPGESCTYWLFTTAAIVRMLEYAGFDDCEPMTPYRLPPYGLPMRTVRARPRSRPGLTALNLTSAEYRERFPVPDVLASPRVDPLDGDPALSPLLDAAHDELRISAQLQRDLMGGTTEARGAVETYRRHLTEVEAYVRHLESELAAKEGYIASLEAMVRTSEPRGGE